MVRIGFTGDFCPWHRTKTRFKSKNWEEDFETVQSFFAQNHLNITDLECPLIKMGKTIPKTGPHLCAHPDTAAILSHLNIRLAATANNHFFDYGWEGMQSTYQALEKEGIAWLGSGINHTIASAPHFQEIEGRVFAILNLAENEWSTTTGNRPGVNPLDPVANFQQIQNAQRNADYVIVIAHGGHENYPLPSPRIKQLYRFFVDAGASAVIGHHTHIVSGFELYNGAPIFYSLGNFCFDWPGKQHTPWNEGLLVRLIFDKNTSYPHFELEWVYQNGADPGVQLLQGEKRHDKEREQQELNSVIADDEALNAAFNAYCAELKDILLTWIEPYSGKYLVGARIKGLLPSLYSKSKKRLLMNLIRCEAHRDVLLQALKSKIEA
jgi:poly-gamma-glutamate synthesis protein (capsule biosynthesis protein)